MCPQYEYKCPDCDTVFDEIYKLKEYEKNPQPLCPECKGYCAKRHFSPLPIHCDSINDVKWLPSACKVLQKPGEKPITSRSEWKRYCEKTGSICKG